MTASGIHKEPSPGVRQLPPGVRLSRMLDDHETSNSTAPRTPRIVGEPEPEPVGDANHEALHAALLEADTARRKELAALADVVNDIDTQVTALVLNRESRGSTWADLVLRWTSRKWLLPVISGAAALATLAASTFGSLHPGFAAGCGIVATFLGGAFIIMEGRGDNAERVERIRAAAPPAASTSVVSVKQEGG
jgi:hypothetical protein